MYFIATLSGIGIQSIFFIAYLINSYKFIGAPSEKIQYYVTANIPFVTTVLYSIALLQQGSGEMPHPTFLNYFFVEWMITTPMLIVNVGRILHIRLYKYFLLSVSTVLMNFFGYLAHTLPPPIGFAPFSAGALCYIFIIGFLSFLYQRRKSSHNTGQNGCVRSPEATFALWVAKRLIVAIVCAWTLYPTCFLLHLLEAISLDTLIILCVALDILSKAVTTSLILGYYDVVQRRNSFLKFLIAPGRIYPEQVTVQPPPQEPLSIRTPPNNFITLTVETPQETPQRSPTTRIEKIRVHTTPKVFEDL